MINVSDRLSAIDAHPTTAFNWVSHGPNRTFHKDKITFYFLFLLPAVLSEVANKQGKDEEQNQDGGSQAALAPPPPLKFKTLAEGEVQPQD